MRSARHSDLDGSSGKKRQILSWQATKSKARMNLLVVEAKLGNEIGTFVENTRDLRIQAALDHLGREHDVSSVVKNGTHFAIRDDIPGNELKRDVVSLKANLAFL
jgi:hypothetical protein